VLVLLLSSATKGMAQSLLISVVGARVLSSLTNYFMNCKLVFENRNRSSIIRYYLLVAAMLAANYGLMVVITQIMPIAIGKILVELVLYPVSFFIQRKYVFPPQSEELGPEA
jgi:putative flippase GtrA